MTLVPCKVPEKYIKNHQDYYVTQMIRQFLAMDVPCVEITEDARPAKRVQSACYTHLRKHPAPVKPVVRNGKIYLINTTKVALV